MKIYLPISILLFFISCAERNFDNFEPAAEGITFVKKIGGNNPDVGRSVRKSQTGYIISGWTESSGMGLRDMWLINIDSLGNINWQKTFGDHNNDWGYFANSTNDGGFILSGRSTTANVQNGADGLIPSIFVAKTDGSGNELWRALLGSTIRPGAAYQVLETTDHGYIVLSYYDTAIQYSEIPYISVFRLDMNGNELWNYKYIKGSTGYAISGKMDGSYLIVGSQAEVTEFDEVDTNPKRTALVLNIDDSGQLLWKKEFNYSNWNVAKSIKSASEGYIITGQVGDYISGDLDLLLVKIDQQGNEIWHQSYGGDYLDRGNDVIETASGELVAVGNTFSYDSGNGDVFLIKVSANGKPIWSRAIGGDQLDFAYSLAETDDFGYMIVGETQSYNSVQTDLLLIKTDRNGRIKRNENGEIVADN